MSTGWRRTVRILAVVVGVASPLIGMVLLLIAARGH